jgi:predicted RNase H-like HicB family nuclease
MKERTVEGYLRLPYHIEITLDRDDEGNAGWFAEVEELPGCMSQGRTPEEAVHNIFDAMEGWLSVAIEDGIDIPEPRSPTTFSGQFRIRIPRSLHASLSKAAADEGVSLNQFVTGALAAAVHWRGPQGS